MGSEPTLKILTTAAAMLLAVAGCKKQPAPVPASQPAAPQPPATMPATLALDVGKGQIIEMVLVPAGTFLMGSPETEEDRDGSEGPQHAVTIKKPFYMGKFEVTQGQWKAVSGNQSKFQTDDKLPAEQVSWSDCQKWCEYASKPAGKKFRLPSEAEWEYAARAGTKTAFFVGNKLSSTQANFNGTDPYGGGAVGPNLQKTAIVGSYPPNAFGLYDMVGNVSEWCQDVFHDTYDGAPTDGSAWETGTAAQQEIRVYRDGAFENNGSNCRSALRMALERMNARTPKIGFRVVVDAQ